MPLYTSGVYTSDMPREESDPTSEEKAYTLRMRRDLWRKLRRRAADSDKTVKQVILDTLEAAFSNGEKQNGAPAV